jgi:ABC-2 type transport system ATP-binding protein
MIKISKLTKSFNGIKALSSLDLSISKGSVFGLLGPNGAGKTTLLNILNGLLLPDSGFISIDGMDYEYSAQKLRSLLGYLPEAPVFYSYMNPLEYLDFLARFNGASDKTESLLERVGLLEHKKKRIGGFSRGMKQRLGIACALLHDPRFIFLDEPISALDPQGRKDIMTMVRELKDENRTIILSSHILEDIERLADEIAIIHKGELLVHEGIQDLKSHYSTGKFEIEFESAEDSEKIVHVLENLSWVDKLNLEGPLCEIQVHDQEKARKELSTILLETRLPFIRYQEKQMNLEDLFLQITTAGGRR